MRLKIFILFMAFICHAVVYSADKNPITTSISTKKVFIENNKENLIETTRAGFGDLVEYSISYKNNSGESLTNVRASLPYPIGFDYVPNTASPKNALVNKNGLVWEIGTLKPKDKKTVSARFVLKRAPAG